MPDVNTSRDPLEAIYALNIGDFIAESFISNELLDRINNRLASEPEKLRLQLEELVQLYTLKNTLDVLGIHTSRGDHPYDAVATTLKEFLQAQGCFIFYRTEPAGQTVSLELIGSSQSAPSSVMLKALKPELLELYRQSETTCFEKNTSPQPSLFSSLQGLLSPETQSVMAIPLREGGKRLGLILLTTSQAQYFVEEANSFGEVAGRVFVTALEMQHLLNQAQTMMEGGEANINLLTSLRAQITERIADLGLYQHRFMECFAQLIDARFSFTRGHAGRVGCIAQSIAEKLGLNEKTTDLVYHAGLFSALGKVNTPAEVLEKASALTTDEKALIKGQTQMASQLLGRILFLSEVIPFIESSQERWDGSGAPEGLTGQSIPLGSRIIAVADAYQALTQLRPYRETPYSHEEAMAILQQEAGKKWDPAIVDTLAAIPVDSLI